MAEYYNSGECIDGNRVLIRFKKILQQPATYIVSPTGFKGTKYKCSRDGDTEIVVALSPSDAANASKGKNGVHVSVGDRLKCNKAYFIAETPKKLNCFAVTMMSGRHECSEGKPDVRVYAEIEMPFESIAHAAERKLIELQKQKELSSSKNLSLGK